MRVALLNQYYDPDIAATAQLCSDLGAALAARGHDVTAIASARPYHEGGGWRAPWSRTEGVRVVRVPSTARGRSTKRGRALDYATFVAAAAAPLLLARPEVVVALSTPPLVAALGLLPPRSRLVYWVMDVYPEVAVRLGAIAAGGTMARMLTSLSQTLYARAEWVVALDDAMARRLTEAGCPAGKLRVIDNWTPSVHGVDTVSPRGPGPHPLRTALGLEGRMVIGYSGNLGLGHDLDTVLGAVPLVDGVDWLFIGDGPRRAEVEGLVGRHVRLLPPLPRASLADGATAMDASLVTLGAGMAGLVAPSKLYAALAAGVPILYVGPDEGRCAELVRPGADCVGVRIPNGDRASLAAAVGRLRDDRAWRCQLGANARRVFEARFTRQEALAKHVALVEARA